MQTWQWRPAPVLTVLGGLSAGSYVVLFLLGGLRARVPEFLLCFSVAALCYGVAIFFMRRRCSTPPAPGRWLAGILLPALLFRCLLLFSPPSLSDDINRYVWDGRVSMAGHNPYQYAPPHEALADLRDEDVYPSINHPHMPTVYPPVQQAIFAVTSWMQDSVFAFNFASFLGELGCLAALTWLVFRLKLHPANLLVYAWNPLIIIEFAGSGHHDSPGMMLLIIAFGLLVTSRKASSVWLLGLAVLTKFLPLILAPLWYGRRFLKPVALLVLLCACAYLPFVIGGVDPFISFRTYVTHWRFNDFLYTIMYETLSWMPVPEVYIVARLITIAIFGFLYFHLFRQRLQKPASLNVHQLADGTVLLLGVWFLLSPAIHPWYLSWYVPFLAISFRWSWCLATLTAPFSYIVLIRFVQDGIWEETFLLKALLFLPVCILLLYEWRQHAKPTALIIEKTGNHRKNYVPEPLN
jgi:alpha-1,6-mannosyltransferase